jgi:protein-disulfide isomerase-like protein with CxxC motif
VSDKGSDENTWVNASKLATKVRPRVQELLAQIHGQVAESLVYRWEEAMAELTAVQRKAYVDGDNAVVVAAIRQKSKISGLEVDPRANARKAFEDVTDDELDAEIAKAQREIKQVQAGATRH